MKKEIDRILESVLSSCKSYLDIVTDMGVINDVIGNRYFITPHNSSRRAMSMTIVADKIVRIGITYSDRITLCDIELEMNQMADIKYSRYDGRTFFYFKYQGCEIIFDKEGHYEKRGKSIYFDVPFQCEVVKLSKEIFFDNINIRLSSS